MIRRPRCIIAGAPPCSPRMNTTRLSSTLRLRPEGSSSKSDGHGSRIRNRGETPSLICVHPRSSMANPSPFPTAELRSGEPKKPESQKTETRSCRYTSCWFVSPNAIELSSFASLGRGGYAPCTHRARRHRLGVPDQLRSHDQIGPGNIRPCQRQWSAAASGATPSLRLQKSAGKSDRQVSLLSDHRIDPNLSPGPVHRRCVRVSVRSIVSP